MADHILVNFALSSNIPGFQEVVCFIEPQPAEVVEKMMQHLECLQQESSHLMREQLSHTISMLVKLVNEVECNDIADGGYKKMRKDLQKGERRRGSVVAKMIQHLECLQQEASHLMREYRRLKEDVDLYNTIWTFAKSLQTNRQCALDSADH